jgi:hypothetical protein
MTMTEITQRPRVLGRLKSLLKERAETYRFKILAMTQAMKSQSFKESVFYSYSKNCKGGYWYNWSIYTQVIQEQE